MVAQYTAEVGYAGFVSVCLSWPRIGSALPHSLEFCAHEWALNFSKTLPWTTPDFHSPFLLTWGHF